MYHSFTAQDLLCDTFRIYNAVDHTLLVVIFCLATFAKSLFTPDAHASSHTKLRPFASEGHLGDAVSPDADHQVSEGTVFIFGSLSRPLP